MIRPNRADALGQMSARKDLGAAEATIGRHQNWATFHLLCLLAKLNIPEDQDRYFVSWERLSGSPASAPLICLRDLMPSFE
jgi:hypothetical protein